MSWGWFQKEIFNKNANGKWVKTSSSFERAPADVGRWTQSKILEKNSSLGEKTYFKTLSTRSGINQKVVKANTYFGPDKKVVRTLITTSNNLPKKYKRKK